MRPTRCWATRPSASATTSWAPIGSRAPIFRMPPGWECFGRGRPSAGRGAGGAGYEFHFGGTGFSDFFEQLFGSAGGRGAGGFGRSGGFGEEEPGAERGPDIEGDILVTLEEAMRGSVRSVSVRHAVVCDQCGGSGQRNRRVCQACGGNGQVARTESYQVKVPAGVTEGQRLRIAGRGEAGVWWSGGGSYLRVRLARHPDFEVDGQDPIYEAESPRGKPCWGRTSPCQRLMGK